MTSSTVLKCKVESSTVIPLCLQGIHSKTAIGCLKPWIVPNPINLYIYIKHHCQHHYSFPLGPSPSKAKVTWTRHGDTSIVDVTTETATKGLRSKEHVQCEYSGQRDKSLPRQDRAGHWETYHALRMVSNLKPVSCLFLEFFHLILSSWLQVSETAELRHRKGGYCIQKMYVTDLLASGGEAWEFCALIPLFPTVNSGDLLNY